MTNHDVSPPETLDWLAFRYVADELTTEQQAAFERRLIDDQTAREAVAAAVEWTQAAALVEEVVPAEAMSRLSPGSEARRPVDRGDFSAPRRAARSPLAWMAIGAAACIALMTVGQAFFPARPAATGPAGNDLAEQRAAAPVGAAAERAPEELALLWSQTRQAGRLSSGTAAEGDAPAIPLAEPPLTGIDGLAGPLTDFPAPLPDDDSGSLTELDARAPRGTPSWVTAAVSASVGASGTAGPADADPGRDIEEL